VFGNLQFLGTTYMKTIRKTLLAQITGGVAAVSGGGGGGGAIWDGWGGYDGGGYDNFDIGFGGYGDGDIFGAGGSSNDGSGSLSVDFGTVQANVGGGFDSNGVGGNSCVPAPNAPASGLFGYSFTETVAGATAVTGLVAGIGQGVGASLAIEAAGGLSGVGQMGAGAAGLIGSAGLGLGSAFMTGEVVGTVLYNSSETVQDASQAIVGGIIENGPSVLESAASWLLYGPHGEAALGGNWRVTDSSSGVPP
jgi:hypothetical protein